MKNWKELFYTEETENYCEPLFKTIGKEWTLLTAGTKESFNTMTASWATIGVFWNKPVAICFIRPSRYTYKFIEDSEIFTMSFLGEENQEIHKICGSKSGRDTDKIKESGLIPVETINKSVSFEQARLFFECKKIYFDELNPDFILPNNIENMFYPKNDYHRIYFGEILNLYKKI